MAVDVAAVAELAPDPMVVIDAGMIAIWANRAAEELFGWNREAWAGRSVAPLVHPDDLATALLSMGTVTDKPVGTAVEIRIRDADGGYRWAEVRGRPALDTAGIEGVVLVIRDLTDRRRWEVAQGDAALFQTIVQQAPSITLLMDTNGRIRSASRALTRILGYDLEVIEGALLVELAPADARPDIDEHVRHAVRNPDRYRFEARFAHATETLSVPFEVSTVNLSTDPVVSGIVASLHEVTALERVRANLEYLATHDPLTGLANRALLIEHLAAALHRARRHRGDVALFFIDLDGFKAVNDRFGHQAGDELLQRVAATLVDSARAADVVARFGGDEFVVLAPNTDASAANRLAERLDAAIAGTHQLTSGNALISASIGFAISVCGSDNADALLRRADDAMYAIKANRRALKS